MTYEFGFIGCGNMGGALVAAVSQAIGGEKIAVCDKHGEKILPLKEKYGVAIRSAEEIAQNARFVALGVKPQATEAALAPIADILRKRTDAILVTMAAGLSIEGVRKFIRADYPVLRTMPNTPVKVGAGMVVYAAANVPDQAKKEFERALQKAGRVEELPEAQIDGVSALSGCGPAFAYSFAEGLASGAIACGVPEENAALYAAQTLKGAAEMLLAFGDPASLRKAVCSPNGTTLAGIAALDEGNFQKVVESAVIAAYRRALELKK